LFLQSGQLFQRIGPAWSRALHDYHLADIFFGLDLCADVLLVQRLAALPDFLTA
jgi:hypothetical protein